MDKKQLNEFLRSMSYDSEYRILDMAKDKTEIEKVAEKRGLVMPSPDFSIFKCNYAFIEKANLNGCILPKEEVEKSLTTLIGKAVDFDHLRKKIVGHFIDVVIEGDAIIAYGVFFKSNLEEDYEVISELMNQGNLKVSFEAWGVKEPVSSKTYSLNDIHWAGGALLIDTKPAFGEKAEVLELSNKAKMRVMEFAKLMKEPDSFIRSKEDTTDDNNKKKLEKARFYADEFDTVMRLVEQVGSPISGDDFGYHDVHGIDFISGVVRTKWISFESAENDTFCTIYITPRVEEGSTEKKIIKINIEAKKETISEDDKEMDEKIKLLEQEKASLIAEKEKASADLVVATEKVTKLETELAELKAIVEASNKKIEEATAKFEADKAEAIKVAKENATIVANRKAELLDFAKDMSEEDILNNDKYEIAKLKKENSELATKLESAKVVKPETASTQAELAVGSKGAESEVEKTRNKIREYAFGKQSGQN